MTKRSLYITILILLFLDLAAAAWWAAGHFNSDGKQRFLSHEDEAVQADTVADVNRPDTYRLLNDYAYYQGMSPQSEVTYSSAIFIKSQWPVSINGDNSAAELKEALIAKMFGRHYEDIKQAFDSTLAQPRFVSTVKSVKRVATRPAIAEHAGTEYYYRSYPYQSSDRLVEYRVERNSYDGFKKKRTVAMVHYDRLRRQVITVDMVIDLGQKEAVLALVNNRIQHFIDADGMALRHASSLPQEFLLGKSGIVFIFPAGDIASENLGVVEIKVRYDKLQRYLTSYFIEILANNDNYHTYPELHF